MLTDQEFQALMSVLQRAPILPAEQLGLQAIVTKLQTKPPEAPPEAPKP